MIVMQIPEEFYDFCLYLHQDSFYVYGTKWEDIATGALEHMPQQRKLALRAFLDHLLTNDYSDAYLDKIYYSTDAEIGFRDTLRGFLGLVRDTIDRGA